MEALVSTAWAKLVVWQEYSLVQRFPWEPQSPLESERVQPTERQLTAGILPNCQALPPVLPVALFPVQCLPE